MDSEIKNGSNSNNDTIILKIAEPTETDIGTSVVRIGAKFIDKLNAAPGDIVEVAGKRLAPGILQALPVGCESEIARMDEILRYNIDGNFGEDVSIRKAEEIPAKNVFLAPAQPTASGGGLNDFIKENLLKKPVLKGNLIVVDVMGTQMKFLVSNTKPKGIVLVDNKTKFLISEETAEEKQDMPAVTYKDLGGLSKEIETIREMVETPVDYPEVFQHLGIEPPKGILLYGSPGTGKTLLVRAVGNESGAYFISINGSEIMSKWFGESEKRLRDIFDDARKNSPAIIFIDEIDALVPRRDEYNSYLTEFEKRITSQLLTLMDGLHARGDIIVIGATNRPQQIDPAMRRPGRFDREVVIPVPDAIARKEIFQIHTKRMPFSEDVNLDKLSSQTHGFVGADIAALCRESAMHALRRVMPEIRNKKLTKEILKKLVVQKQDFFHALKTIEPSAMREVLIEMPDVKWDDIGGLDDVKGELKEMVEWPLKYSETFKKIGIKSPRGIMLYGPPGCGKTMIAKAVANESCANFISISAPSLISMWFGASSIAIREIFRKARQVAPSIIFFDEIDSLATTRSQGLGDSASKERASIVNTLLTEIDGMQELKNVVVMGATNRPDLIDTALLRPGRFGKLVFIPVPDEDARNKILKVNLKNMSISDDVIIDEIITNSGNFSGADINALCIEAGLFAVRENRHAEEVKMKHFKQAMKKIHPSMSDYEIKKWEKLKDFRVGSRLGEESVSYR